MFIGVTHLDPKSKKRNAPNPYKKVKRRIFYILLCSGGGLGSSEDLGMAALGGVALNRDEHGGSE